MSKPVLKLVTPTPEIDAVTTRTMPRRPPNAELRSREYLTPSEVDQLMDAAKGNRYGHRDATMILITYRHGFRAAEVCPAPPSITHRRGRSTAGPFHYRTKQRFISHHQN